MAITSQWYVDPVNGDDGTGDGTSDSTAWQTVNHAISNLTIPSTGGAKLNLKDNGTHTLTANLSSLPGTAASPFQINGYTSTADDGGVATIECSGYKIASSSEDYIALKNLLIQNTGSAIDSCIVMGSYCVFDSVQFINCNTSSQFINSDSSGSVRTISNCVFSDINGYCVRVVGINWSWRNNYFYNSGSKTITSCIYCANTYPQGNFGSNYLYNIFNLSSTSTGIESPGGGGYSGYADQIINNTFFTSGTGYAISRDNGDIMSFIENNYFEGWGTAIRYANISYCASNNYFYDNTNNLYSSPSDGIDVYQLNTDNNLTPGTSGISKTGSNTYANRFTYFEPTGDAIDGSRNGLYIGAVPPAAGGGGGSAGIIRVPGMGGGFNG